MKTQYGTFNGDSWESFCQQCFKLKYESDGYQEMPAWQGDLGIEGFTRTGILVQCYCPDNQYNPDALYVKQRDKITFDLRKLVNYKRELLSYLKGIMVSKWIFVTPEYKNKELVKHCQEKAEEYRQLGLGFLAHDFDVLVQDIEFFAEQIPIVLRFRQEKLNINPDRESTDQEIADWKSKSINFVNNAINKHGQRIPDEAKNYDDKVNQLTQGSIGDFLNGEITIRKWAEKYQDQYEKFQRVVDLYEKRVEEKCIVSNGNDNNKLYNEIEMELREKIKSTFDYLEEEMIDRLIYRVMADWILRCPINFE